MSIIFAPPMGQWFFSRLLDSIPVYRRFRTRKQNKKTYFLAKKAADYNFSVKVIDSGWATQKCFTDSRYRTLTRELFEFDESIGYKLCGGVSSSLHWSRRYEYPYAVINSDLPEQPSEEFKILDCGAGTGPLQFYFAKRGNSYYSFDQDMFSLRRVARFKAENGLKNFFPVYGNILDIPFPNSYFNRIFCISTLEHILEPLGKDTEVVLKGVVNELLRVLKPDGLLVLTFDVNMSPQKSAHRLYPNEYKKLCEILGISPEPPPENRLCSSDSREGEIMGKDLSVYCATITHCNK